MEAEARITSVENWQIQRQGWTFEVTDKADGSIFGCCRVVKFSKTYRSEIN